MFIVFDIIATGPSAADSHVDKTFVERLRILNDFLSEECDFHLTCVESA